MTDYTDLFNLLREGNYHQFRSDVSPLTDDQLRELHVAIRRERLPKKDKAERELMKVIKTRDNAVHCYIVHCEGVTEKWVIKGTYIGDIVLVDSLVVLTYEECPPASKNYYVEDHVYMDCKLYKRMHAGNIFEILKGTISDDHVNRFIWSAACDLKLEHLVKFAHEGVPLDIIREVAKWRKVDVQAELASMLDEPSFIPEELFWDDIADPRKLCNVRIVDKDHNTWDHIHCQIIEKYYIPNDAVQCVDAYVKAMMGEMGDYFEPSAYEACFKHKALRCLSLMLKRTDIALYHTDVEALEWIFSLHPEQKDFVHRGVEARLRSSNKCDLQTAKIVHRFFPGLKSHPDVIRYALEDKDMWMDFYEYVPGKQATDEAFTDLQTLDPIPSEQLVTLLSDGHIHGFSRSFLNAYVKQEKNKKRIVNPYTNEPLSRYETLQLLKQGVLVTEEQM